MLTPEVIEVPFLSFPSPCKRPWGEGEERNVGTSITSFSSFSCLLFLCQRTQRKDRKKSWPRAKRKTLGPKVHLVREVGNLRTPGTQGLILLPGFGEPDCEEELRRPGVGPWEKL